MRRGEQLVTYGKSRQASADGGCGKSGAKHDALPAMRHYAVAAREFPCC